MEIVFWSIATFWALHVIMLSYVASSAIAARLLGITVEKVWLGAGPTLCRATIRSIEFRWALLPISSGLKTPQDFDSEAYDEQDEYADDPDERESPATRMTSHFGDPRRPISDVPLPAQIFFLLTGPTGNLLLALLLFGGAAFLPQSKLVVGEADAQLVTPSAVPGLAMVNESATISSQWRLFEDTFLSYWYPPKFMKKDWGGVFGALITCVSVGQRSFGGWLSCVGVLSVGMCMFNMFPLPLMNGGRLLLLVIQRVVGPLPQSFLERFLQFSFMFYFVFAMLIVFADISFVKSLWR